jgi:restriction system protein
MPNLSALEARREAFVQAHQAAYPDRSLPATRVEAGVLWRFVREMAEGDLIVFPCKADRRVYLGRLVGDYFEAPDLDADYPQRRRVEWLADRERAGFSRGALYEIGSALSLFTVRSHAREILAMLTGSAPDEGSGNRQTGEPLRAEQIGSLIETAPVDDAERTADFILQRLHSRLDGFGFEEFVADLLRGMGYTARVTQRSGDGGVDILASQDRLGLLPPLLKVQCKKVLDSIGHPVVSQLYGQVSHGENGLFVALGSYTREARAFERQKHNLRLIDGTELVDLILENYERLRSDNRLLLPLRRVWLPDMRVET